MHCDTRTPSEIVATVVDAITACPTRTDPACLKGAAVTLNQIGEQPCCYEGSTDCNGETWIYRFCFLTPTTYFFSITIELFPGVEASYFCISDTYAEGEVYVLSKEEGGRHTPFFNGYKPQFYIRTTDITGSIELPEGVEMVMPGDNINMKIKLIYPVALEKGLRFAIREGGRTVGAGTITSIIE